MPIMFISGYIMYLMPGSYLSLPVRFGSFLLLAYVNECLTSQSMGQKNEVVFAKEHITIAYTQSHRPEDTIPDSYDKCEPGLKLYYARNYASIIQDTTKSVFHEIILRGS